MKKMLIAGMIAASLLTLLSACGAAAAQSPINTAQSGLEAAINSLSQVTKDTAVVDVIQNPAFDGFGQFLFPVEFRAQESSFHSP